jgi:hypothetical protein
MGSLLKAAIGGLPLDFNVVSISDQVLRFLVSCNQVSFSFINCSISNVKAEWSIFIFGMMGSQLATGNS